MNIISKIEKEHETKWTFTLSQLELDAIFNPVINKIYIDHESIIVRRDVKGWYYTHTSYIDSSIKDVYITPNTEFYYKDEKYLAPMFTAHDDYVSLLIENIDERNIWWELLHNVTHISQSVLPKLRFKNT